MKTKKGGHRQRHVLGAVQNPSPNSPPSDPRSPTLTQYRNKNEELSVPMKISVYCISYQLYFSWTVACCRSRIAHLLRCAILELHHYSYSFLFCSVQLGHLMIMILMLLILSMTLILTCPHTPQAPTPIWALHKSFSEIAVKKGAQKAVEQ